MKRIRIFWTLLASILVLAGLSVAPQTAAAATSDDTCVGINTMSGSGDCWDYADGSFSAAKASTSAEVVAVNGVSVHSSVKVVSRIQATGATKAQMQGKKVRLPHRMTLWTSYYNTSNQEVWHKKTYPKGKVLVKGKDGYFHDPVCWNKVKYKTKKPVGKKIYGSIKIVKYFVFEAKSVATVSDYVKALAMAWDNSANCHAEATGSGSASFYATASAYLKGTVLVKLLAQVRAQSSENLSVKLAGKSLVDIHGQTSASAAGQATAEATAAAVCKETPPQNQPPTGEIVQWPAHLYPGGTYRAKVVGSDPEDLGNVTLTYSVTGGASKIVDADHPEICDVEGTQRVCYFWIKAGPTSGVNATLSLTVKDSKGLTFNTSKTWPIVADEF